MVKTPDRDLGGGELSSPYHPPQKDNLNQLDALLGLMAELRIIDQQSVNSRQQQTIDVSCAVVTEENIVRENTVNLDLSIDSTNLPIDESIDLKVNQTLDHHLPASDDQESLTNHDPSILVNDDLISSPQDNLPIARTNGQNITSAVKNVETDLNVVRSLLDMINVTPGVDHADINNPDVNNADINHLNINHTDTNNIDDQSGQAVLKTNNIFENIISENINEQAAGIGDSHKQNENQDNHENIARDITINQPEQSPSNPPAEDNFKFLQDLLFGKEISQIDDFNAKIDQKLLAIEQQLYQPDRLINLLLPVIGELLNLKVIEARDEITDAIAPIIDQIIATKSELDPAALSRAIAPILPDAITTQIRQYPKDIAVALGPEMGAAIREQIKIDPEEISSAIAPEMGRAIKEQIVLERDAMVDALYPVIGNTISKYMVEAIREINDKVANAFSVEGVQRKIKAKVQGVSEAELILSEAIKSTVQAIFLIHKGSGLVIAEVQDSGEASLESEMVAGMLTAIRSFVNDCIVPEGQISELNEIEYGDSKIVIEVAGYCYLSAIVKGDPSKLFIKKLRDTLAEIIIKHGKYIENFDGDTTLLPPAVNQLLEKLMLAGNPTQEKNHVNQPVLLFLILGIVTLIAIPFTWHSYQRQSVIKQEKLVQGALANTPELAVYNLQAKIEKGQLFLTGRVPDYATWQKATAVARQTLPNTPVFNEILPVFVPPNHQKIGKEVTRLTQVFNEKPGVKITSKYAEGKVTINGTVQQNADSQAIVKTISQINGVKSVVSGIKYVPLEFDKRIYFRPSSATVDPIYQNTLEEIKQVLTKFPRTHLRIIGHSDRLGTPQGKRRLAQQRAESVQAALLGIGIENSRLEVSASQELPKNVKKEEPLLLGRCVTFEIFTPKD
jgi:outer membrane protein OmpA-like peptidoglycan-associated protein